MDFRTWPGNKTQVRWIILY